MARRGVGREALRVEVMRRAVVRVKTEMRMVVVVFEGLGGWDGGNQAVGLEIGEELLTK